MSVQTEGLQKRRFFERALAFYRPFLECSRLVVDVQRSAGARRTAIASGHKKIVEIGYIVAKIASIQKSVNW